MVRTVICGIGLTIVGGVMPDDVVVDEQPAISKPQVMASISIAVIIISFSSCAMMWGLFLSIYKSSLRIRNSCNGSFLLSGSSHAVLISGYFHRTLEIFRIQYPIPLKVRKYTNILLMMDLLLYMRADLLFPYTEDQIDEVAYNLENSEEIAEQIKENEIKIRFIEWDFFISRP